MLSDEEKMVLASFVHDKSFTPGLILTDSDLREIAMNGFLRSIKTPGRRRPCLTAPWDSVVESAIWLGSSSRPEYRRRSRGLVETTQKWPLIALGNMEDEQMRLEPLEIFCDFHPNVCHNVRPNKMETQYVNNRNIDRI
jgi:hypothetical protein